MQVHFITLGGSVKHLQTLVRLGRHGKNSITGMIRHVMSHTGRAFDYLVGPRLEGDEYLISNISGFLLIRSNPNGLLIYNVTDEECMKLVKQKNKAQQKGFEVFA